MSVDGKWKTVENGKLKESKEKTAPPPPPGPPPNFAASFGAAADAGITPPIVLLERTLLRVDPSPTPNCSKGKNTGGKGRKDPPDPDIMPPVGVINGLGLAMHDRARFGAFPATSTPKGSKGPKTGGKGHKDGKWQGYPHGSARGQGRIQLFPAAERPGPGADRHPGHAAHAGEIPRR